MRPLIYSVMTYWETAEQRNPSAPEHELDFARVWKQLRKLVRSRRSRERRSDVRLPGRLPALPPAAKRLTADDAIRPPDRR
jgi:hypothetical protein